MNIRQGYNAGVRVDCINAIPTELTASAVLEVGADYGPTLSAAKSKLSAAKAIASDMVQPQVGLAAGVDGFELGNLDDLDFLPGIEGKHGKFDFIMALDVLEHLVDPWTTVRQFHEMLPIGGHVLVSIPNVNHTSVAWELFAKGKWELQDAGILDRTHLRFFVKDTIVELMTSSGLELVSIVPNMAPHRWIKRPILKQLFYHRLERFWAYQYVVLMRRAN